MLEYIVSLRGRTYIRGKKNNVFYDAKDNKKAFDMHKTHLIAYRGTNEIKAKYTAVKQHYDHCIERGETNEYGMVMLAMDIQYYEDQYPEWII